MTSPCGVRVTIESEYGLASPPGEPQHRAAVAFQCGLPAGHTGQHARTRTPPPDVTGAAGTALVPLPRTISDALDAAVQGAHDDGVLRTAEPSAASVRAYCVARATVAEAIAGNRPLAPVEELAVIAAGIIGHLIRGAAVHITLAELRDATLATLRNEPDGGMLVTPGDETVAEYMSRTVASCDALAAALDGQRALKEQTVRIRRALGVSEGDARDTEAIAARVYAALQWERERRIAIAAAFGVGDGGEYINDVMERAGVLAAAEARAAAVLDALREIVVICNESRGECRKRMGTRIGNCLVAARAALDAAAKGAP